MKYFAIIALTVVLFSCVSQDVSRDLPISEYDSDYVIYGDTTAIGIPERPIRSVNYSAISPYRGLPRLNSCIYTARLHNRTVTVEFEISPQGITETEEYDFVEYIFNVWNYYWNVFDGFCGKDYTIVYNEDIPFTSGNMGLSGYRVAYSQGQVINQEIPMAIWMPLYDGFFHAAHEVFHGWNSWSAKLGGKNSENMWFGEGLNDYFALKAWALYKDGIRSRVEINEDFDRLMRNHEYAAYMNSIRNMEDLPLAELGASVAGMSQGYRSIVYNKGCLFSYMLDEKLHSVDSSLEVILRALSREYYGREFSLAEMITVIEDETNSDFTVFFQTYLFDTAVLPLDQDTKYTLYLDTETTLDELYSIQGSSH